MRIAPIGFFFYDDGEMLRKNALLCTRITHRHPEAMAGALAQAMAVGMATHRGIVGETMDRLAFLEEIVQGVEGVDSAMAAEIKRIKELDTGGDLEARIERIARTFPRDVSAIGAVPAAIASFLINDDFPATVVTAINCGGDTDTIGAMAGAIAGAYHGYAAIPTAWCKPLENGAKGSDYVAMLAEELARIKARHKGWI
jgi:ADP-ribosylglycohydrolase